jgi:hypothetical protein
MLNLDSAAFRAWLTAHRPTERVGYANIADYCPLACWYASLGYDASVASQAIELYGAEDGETVNFIPSPWQAAFIDAVDNCGEGTITAAAALEMLACVERLGMEVQG